VAHRALVILARWWPWAMAVAVLWPVLAPGYVLSYDMVFVPDLALRPDFLGLGSGLPRAVPSDAVVAVIDEVVPGMVLQKVVLLGALVLAGAGARRLLPADDPVGQLAAATVYVWSPLVAERLVIGHWPLLLTYAALPWLYMAARRLREGRSGFGPVVLWLALASLSAAGGVLASVLALLAVAGRGPGATRRTFWVAVAALVVNGPWLVAGILQGAAALSDPAAVQLFAAHGEAGMPAWLTVLGLGGIWNAEVVPTSRTGWPAWVAVVLLLTLAAWGALGSRSRHRGPHEADHGHLALVAAAGVGLVVTLAGILAPGPMGWVVQHVPGGGLLRDGTRGLVLVAPLVALLVARGIRALAERVPHGAARTILTTVLVLAPVALLPDLAGGASGRLDPVDFPDEYTQARETLAARAERRDEPADLLVLPFSSYRLPEWNDGRRTLDPLGRFMTPDYLASDTLVVSGTEIAGEDPRARRVHELLDQAPTDATGTANLSDALVDQGVGWVLLDRAAASELAGRVPSADLTGQPVVHAGDQLVVWELSGPVPDEAAPFGARAATALAWSGYVVAVLLAILAGVLDVARRLVGSRRVADRTRPDGC
jgi:hypothetical protein